MRNKGEGVLSWTINMYFYSYLGQNSSKKSMEGPSEGLSKQENHRQSSHHRNR